MKALCRAIKKLLDAVEPRDIIVTAGIILLTVGLWMVYVPLALITLGTLLIVGWVYVPRSFGSGKE